MRNTLVQTVALPQVGEREPIAVAYAPEDVEAWAVIRNNSPVVVSLGFSSQDVSGPEGLGSSIFQIYPGQSDTFRLNKKQKLYAISSGPKGQVSVHVYEGGDHDHPRPDRR